MKRLKELVSFDAGSPQFRVTDLKDNQAPVYYYYTVDDLRADLVDEMDVDLSDHKQISTHDNICLTNEGDVIVSLVTTQATLVRKARKGLFLTQNFLKVKTGKDIDPTYFIYLFNEDKSLKKQLSRSSNGEAVKKSTIKQLENLVIEHLPDLETQRRIGEIYLKQKRLTYLRNEESKLSELYVIEKIRGGH